MSAAGCVEQSEEAKEQGSSGLCTVGELAIDVLDF